MRINLYVMFLLVFCLPITMQGQTVEEQLTGTWLFDDAKSFHNLSAATLAHFDSIPASEVRSIKELYIGRKLTFNADGSFIQQLSDGSSVGGSWVFNSSDNTLVLKHPLGGEFTQTVKQLSTNNLLLTPLSTANFKMIIDQWYYTKL